jgi:hypothetical protein
LLDHALETLGGHTQHAGSEKPVAG